MPDDSAGATPSEIIGGTATITVEPAVSVDASARIVLAGELDVASAGPVKAALVAQFHDGADVLLDMGAVSFIDSTGLAAVIGASNIAKDLGRSLTIAPQFQPQPRRLLELTQVLGTLPIAADD